MAKYTITKSDFTTRNGDEYYTGPLRKARKAFRKDNTVTATKKDGMHVIHATFGLPDELKSTSANCDAWGCGETKEIAWRYLIGAEWAPADSTEFAPFDI